MIFAIIAAGCVALGGCEQTWEERFVEYVPSDSRFDSSINGNSVFYDLCRSRGARCRRARAVSPMLKRYDCIVWFCTENRLPETETIAWFEDWLENNPGKTLVFVGRSYEADVSYWEKILPLAPEEGNQRGRANIALAEAKRKMTWEFGSPETMKTPETANRDSFTDFSFMGDDSWFELRKFGVPLAVTTLEGEERFYGNVDPERMELVLYGGVVPRGGEDVRILLSGRGRDVQTRRREQNARDRFSLPEVLIAEKRVGESRVLMIPSGTFVLNYPMTNAEHRKLASSLLDEIAPKNKRVVFLKMGCELQESSGHAPPSHAGMRLLQTWPAAPVLWHMIFLGILVCFWKWPVFGRPGTLPARRLSDFMLHVRACAFLLEHPANVAYAREQIARFRDKNPTEPPQTD